jgi:replicative DNA helicase
VVAAVARTKDKRGRSSYHGDGLNLASFRESSELEFGADDAFILVPDDDDSEYGTMKVTLRHLKARHTEPKDLVLEFDRHLQRFSEAKDPRVWNPDGKIGLIEVGVQSELAAMWDQTAPADEDQAEEEQKE